MFSTLRTRFGIPGVISVIALVFAMLGGAYAAQSNSGGKATASKAGKRGPRGPKGATGPAGPQGPAGLQGPAGANGKDGTNGTNGTNGTPGKSVKLINSAPTNCTEGGFTYEVEGSGVKNEVCNGEEGQQGPQGEPWTAGGTLPEGATETGAYSVVTFSANILDSNLSFAIPLEAALGANEVHIFTEANFSDFDEGGPGTEGCTGSAAAPTAPSGNLCVYGSTNGPALGPFVKDPSTEQLGASVAGAYLEVGFSGAGNIRGTWAVTG